MAGRGGRRAAAAGAQRGRWPRSSGVDPEALRAGRRRGVLAGNVVPDGATPVAQAYAGHQFGAYSPRLGDGRALLLGEVVDAHGRRRDLHLKGSGRTPFARGGDGKAVVGPMLREYVIGEAMHALGIPTSRALAVVATGERRRCARRLLPGAVLARVAASHIRVGTFQYAAHERRPDARAAARRLLDRRHHPDAAEAENPYLAFYERVVDAQASLVAQWMLVGFIHGVMNTDNMAISGETIDYGPCAFMDAFDPATVFSSIDHGGRYAYGNQPHDRAVEPRAAGRGAAAAHRRRQGRGGRRGDGDRCKTFPDRFHRHWSAGMRAKLGLAEADDVTDALDRRPAGAAARARPSTTPRRFRALSASLRGDAPPPFAVRRAAAFDAWAERWREQLAHERADPARSPRDGPRQPGLHPAQPPGRGGAGRRDRRRPRAVRAPARRPRPTRSTSGPAWSPTPRRPRRAAGRTRRSAAPNSPSPYSPAARAAASDRQAPSAFRTKQQRRSGRDASVSVAASDGVDRGADAARRSSCRAARSRVRAMTSAIRSSRLRRSVSDSIQRTIAWRSRSVNSSIWPHG